jgi:hypothetical protein
MPVPTFFKLLPLPACLAFLPAYQLLHFWQPASRGASAMESICSLCGAC